MNSVESDISPIATARGENSPREQKSVIRSDVVGVTGGSGAIGSQLIRALIRDPSVTSIWVLTRRRDPEALARLAAGQEKIRLMDGDVLNPNVLENMVSACGTIYHLGAWSGLGRMPIDDALAVNTLATALMMAAAWRHGARVVFASTFRVYDLGTLKKELVSEDDLVLGDEVRNALHAVCSAVERLDLNSDRRPNVAAFQRAMLKIQPAMANQDLYGFSKLAAEGFVRRYPNGLALRLSNVYGPGDTSDRTVPRFMREMSAAKSGDVKTFAPGRVNSYLYVEDLVRALLASRQTPIHPAANVINITHPDPVSQERVFRAMQALTRSKAEIRPMSTERMSELGIREPAAVRFDVTRLEHPLGISLSSLTALDQGLARTKRWLLDLPPEQQWGVA